MNYLNIKMNSRKKLIYAGKLILGEKMDHNVYSLKFDIPQNFEQENKYCIFHNKEKNIKLSYKLNENNCVNISSNITKNAITYDIMLVMFKSSELTDDNIVCISDSIKGIVNNNDLEISDIEDDTDSFIIVLSSDMNDINQSIQSVNSNIETIKTDLIDEIIESNTETKNTVQKITEQLSTLSTTIVDNIQNKLEILKEKITEDNAIVIEKITENNKELVNINENINETKTELLSNEDKNKDLIIEKINELETSNNLTYDVLDEVNETIKNEILCKSEVNS